jgi:hypothetical protein
VEPPGIAVIQLLESKLTRVLVDSLTWLPWLRLAPSKTSTWPGWGQAGRYVPLPSQVSIQTAVCGVTGVSGTQKLISVRR